MKSSLILDLVVKEAEISPNLTGLKFPVWLIIRVDGSQQPFSTPEADDLKHPVWNYPARICVSLGHNDLSRAYLYVTLCTFGDGRIGIKPLGRARVSLKSLPIGDAKSFFFPLMMQNDLTKEACTLKFAATISFFSPQLMQPALCSIPQGNQFGVFSQNPVDRYFPK